MFDNIRKYLFSITYYISLNFGSLITITMNRKSIIDKRIESSMAVIGFWEYMYPKTIPKNENPIDTSIFDTEIILPLNTLLV